MRRLLILAILLCGLEATAQERQIAMDFMGFSADGEHFVVKRYDHHVGWGISVRSLADGTQVREHLYTSAEEKQTLARVKRRHKLQEGTGPRSPDERYVALGAQNGDQFDILIMRKPLIGRFQEIPLRSADTPQRGEAILKKAAWSPDGRHLVVILNEKTSGLGAWERDTVYAYRFRPWDVTWFRAEEKEEKKENDQ